MINDCIYLSRMMNVYFYANDDRPIVWAPIGEPSLWKKGQGKTIMVSEFLLEIIGRLKLTSE